MAFVSYMSYYDGCWRNFYTEWKKSHLTAEETPRVIQESFYTIDRDTFKFELFAKEILLILSVTLIAE